MHCCAHASRFKFHLSTSFNGVADGEAITIAALRNMPPGTALVVATGASADGPALHITSTVGAEKEHLVRKQMTDASR